MFDFIRNHLRWAKTILIVLVLLSFCFVGLQSYTNFTTRSNGLVKIGNKSVTDREFDRVWQTQLEEMKQYLGVRFDPKKTDMQAMQKRSLQQLVDQKLLIQLPRKHSVMVCDEILGRSIASIPQLQESGHFSSELYKEMLLSYRIPFSTFEEFVRQKLKVLRTLDTIKRSTIVPATIASSINSALTQNRTISIRRYVADNYRNEARALLTPKDIHNWYATYKNQLYVPAQAKIQYVLLDKAEWIQKTEVLNKEVQIYYEENLDLFRKPESRRASHILLRIPKKPLEEERSSVRKKADLIVQKANANPEKFSQLVRQYSQDLRTKDNDGDIGWFTKSTNMSSLESAIFSCDSNRVLDVVESSLGLHIIMVTDISPETNRPLEKARAGIVDNIRARKATLNFHNAVSRLETLAYKKQNSLKEVASDLGIKLHVASSTRNNDFLLFTSKKIGPESNSPDFIFLNNEQVLRNVFSSTIIQQSRNSRIIEVKPGVVLALSVVKTREGHSPVLEEIDNDIYRILSDSQVAKAAHLAGAVDLKRLQNEYPQTGLKEFGQSITVSRIKPQNLPLSILETIMNLPTENLPVYAGTNVGIDYVIVCLKKVETSSARETAKQELLLQQLSNLWGSEERLALLKNLYRRYKLSLNPKAYRIIKSNTLI